jgi:hypothetical protein
VKAKFETEATLTSRIAGDEMLGAAASARRKKASMKRRE